MARIRDLLVRAGDLAATPAKRPFVLAGSPPPLDQISARLAEIRHRFSSIGKGEVVLSVPESLRATVMSVSPPPSSSAASGQTVENGQQGHAPGQRERALEIVSFLDRRHVAAITIRNPAKRNALSPRMMVDLSDAVWRLEQLCEKAEGLGTRCGGSGAVRRPDAAFALSGLVLHGEGGQFSSGFDLGVAAESFLTPQSGSDFSLLMHDTISRLRRLPLVSVAAIQGHAMGGGAELAAACDMRIMDEEAKLRFVQVKMGLAPGWQGATRLTELVGRSKALWLLASTQQLTARECERLGLAEEVVPSALERATELLERWSAETYPVAIRGVKRVVHEASVVGELESIEHERAVFETLWGAEANVGAINGLKKKSRE